MESLKKMIYSWLAEFYPDMSEDERIKMANTMDVSLIEKKKEESMKTFYEINNVVRMSFIEMQYMKKVSTSCSRTAALFDYHERPPLTYRTFITCLCCRK